MSGVPDFLGKITAPFSVSPKRTSRSTRPLHARTERLVPDVKKRYGKGIWKSLESIDLSRLPAIANTGRDALSDRDLSVIGAVMDTHLRLSGFYVHTSEFVFMYKPPEVGAAPLRQAIIDELNVRLMPPPAYDSEISLQDMQGQFGADVMSYVHTIDLSDLLFPDHPDLRQIPSVIRDMARIVLDEVLGGIGYFCKQDDDVFAILFFSPSPDFAARQISKIQDQVRGRTRNLVKSYAAHFEDEQHPEYHVTADDGIDPKVQSKSISPQIYTPGKVRKREEELSREDRDWLAAFSGTIDEAAHASDRFEDRLPHLPWDQGIRYDPILRHRTKSIVGKFCRPAQRRTMNGHEEHETYRTPTACEAVPDVPLVKDLVNDIQLNGLSKNREILCLPVHYHTIANHLYREALLSHLATLPKQDLHYVSAELIGFNKDVAPFVINDYIRMLKPYFRTVLIQADINGKLLEHFAGLPVHAAGFDLDFPGLDDKASIAKIKRFAERSHYYFRRVYVRGANTKKQVLTALGEDFNYISGPVLKSS